MSRRQAIGRMSAVATAGAAAWVVPEILTAKPAGGATPSGPPVQTSPASTGAVTTGAPTNGLNTAATATTRSSSLAFSGLDIQRDAEIGAALIAGGWAMQHWASRESKRRPTA